MSICIIWVAETRFEMDKQDKLENILKELKSVVVAFSGGVDSSFLTVAARNILGKENVLAVTAKSETYTSSELNDAIDICRTFDVEHKIIDTNELSNKDFSDNPPNRCYFCKSELFNKLNEIARAENKGHVIDATNIDDKEDFRPGRLAAEEFNVRSPLIEAGIAKDEIREYSRKLGLFTWNKPQMACLASRFPYGEKITKENLKRVEIAEGIIREAGIKQVRVRIHSGIARIEVLSSDIDKLINEQSIINKIKLLGFSYVTVDLEGYRSGSMNEVLNIREKEVKHYARAK